MDTFGMMLRGPQKGLFSDNLYDELYGSFESQLLDKLRREGKKEWRTLENIYDEDLERRKLDLEVFLNDLEQRRYHFN